jgi:hypothetical protein
MLTTEKTKHPLERHGTTQRERLLKALIPENLQLDDSSIADVLAFVGEYAKQIRYWSSENKPDGDWAGFWEKDATALMAIVAATDIDDIRVKYRNQELIFLRQCKKEKQDTGKSYCENALKSLHELVGQIFDVALKIQSLCEKLPSNHPLKAEVQGLIREKLGIGTDAKGSKDYEKPIGTLISYHKVSYDIINPDEKKPELINLYQPFIGNTHCQLSWGLTEHDFLTCIDYKATVDETDREALWLLFLTFFKVLTLIVSKAEKAFNLALHGRRDHPPHITLFLAFTMLFRRYHLADMNGLLAKHLVYYYRDVLRLQERREIPDKVHIVFEIAQNIETYRLQKDTLLLGGKDSKGLDRLYALMDELVVNKAQLVEKQSLYFYKNTLGKVFPIALPFADLKDGFKVPYTEGARRWHPLSGEAIYQKLLTKKQALGFYRDGDSSSKIKELSRIEVEMNKLQAKPGIIISSPELWLAKGGNRTIAFNINIDISTLNANEIGLLKDLLGNFYVDISTKDKIVEITEHHHKLSFSAGNLSESAYEFINVQNNSSIKWQIKLREDFPDVMPSNELLYNNINNQPFIRLRLKEDIGYEFIKNIFSSITLHTENSGLKNLNIQLGSTLFPTTAEIPLVGSTMDKTKLSLFVVAPELSAKKTKTILSLPFKDVESHNIVSSIKLEETDFKENVFFQKEKLDLKVADFENNIQYSRNSPFAFFKKTVVIPVNGENKPINIVKLPPESISVSYVSEDITLALADEDTLSYPHKIYFHDFLGGYSFADVSALVRPNKLPDFDEVILPIIPAIIKPTPPKTADGNLRLGFEDLKAGQSLSLLFHFADGTGNPDHIAPDEIVWSYLRQNKWVRIPPTYILLDETLGLRQTGIVKIQIPSDINNGNTLAVGKEGRLDLFWLQASASEDPENNIFVDALPMLIDIFPQAATAVFQNNNNDLVHIEKGLDAKIISQLRFRDSNISSVLQPFESFDGRFSEAGDRNAYYRRISERLRHKQRAITVWDYERLTLEKFPKIAIAKCLPHTRDIDVERPRYVTMGIVPYPERMVGDRKYYPIFNAGFLEAVENYLNRHNSYFVSGWGGGVVCCCASENEADCTCGHDGYLVVRNAIFEPVRLQICVKFRAGKDIFFYKKQLNEDLKNFLAPWATDTKTPLLFGASIQAVEILRFLENLDYVDVVMGLKIKHFPNREAAEKHENDIDFEEAEIIEPYTLRSVLTTYLDILNEDNPNVIDHDIKIVEDQACCADCEPKVDAAKK